MTNQDILNFFKQYLGKPVEVEDPTNLDQCYDWAFKYVQFLGLPIESIGGHLRAYQIWTDVTPTTKQYFDLIPNTPTAVPQCGDIVIFSTVVGVSGHVSVATGVGDVNSFQSTDQNWAGKLFIQYITHNYNGVLGWLRPKLLSSQPTTGGTTTNTDTKALVEFDRTIQYLNSVSILPSSAREQNLGDHQVANAIKAYHDNMESIKTKYEALIAQPPTNLKALKDKIIAFIDQA